MKKKMTILGTLLLSVLVTGYSVSGTYAKYVSSVDKSDEARVAKFNLNVDDASSPVGADGKYGLFHSSYDKDGKSIVKSVSPDKQNIVAPGVGGIYTFAINGIAETNYTLSITKKDDSKNLVNFESGDSVELRPATTVNGQNVPAEIFTAEKAYDPIRFKVSTTVGGYEGSWVTFDQLQDELTKAVNTVTVDGAAVTANDRVYGPSTNIGSLIGDIQIEWKWAFDATEAATIGSESMDDYDTALATKFKDFDTTSTDDALKDAIIMSMSITATQTQSPVTE